MEDEILENLNELLTKLKVAMCADKYNVDKLNDLEKIIEEYSSYYNHDALLIEEKK
jgi:hypothetical protein